MSTENDKKTDIWIYTAMLLLATAFDLFATAIHDPGLTSEGNPIAVALLGWEYPVGMVWAILVWGGIMFAFANVVMLLYCRRYYQGRFWLRAFYFSPIGLTTIWHIIGGLTWFSPSVRWLY